jgi:threonine dehydrogenase-like Zn-dependent dehydrogenase
MSIPTTMRAVQIKNGKGSSANLYIDDSTPVPKLEGAEERDEVLVKVVAFGLNRMDLLQREGAYAIPPGASPILGVEFSGTVVDAGKSNFTQGQEVFGLTTGGCYSEYVKVPSRMVLSKPRELSWEQAAAIPESEWHQNGAIVSRAETHHHSLTQTSSPRTKPSIISRVCRGARMCSCMQVPRV